MTDDRDDPAWPPAVWANQLQEMSEDAVEQQTRMFRQFLESSPGGSASGPLGGLGAMGMGSAVFKTRVQSGGRISIPDAEREALDIEEGDIVQTVVVPIKSSE
jgi:hypothetical protein